MATERSYQDRGLPFRKYVYRRSIDSNLIVCWSGQVTRSDIWPRLIDQLIWSRPRSLPEGKHVGTGATLNMRPSVRSRVRFTIQTGYFAVRHIATGTGVCARATGLWKIKICCHGCELWLNWLILCEAKGCCCLCTCNNGRHAMGSRMFLKRRNEENKRRNTGMQLGEQAAQHTLVQEVGCYTYKTFSRG